MKKQLIFDENHSKLAHEFLAKIELFSPYLSENNVEILRQISESLPNHKFNVPDGFGKLSQKLSNMKYFTGSTNFEIDVIDGLDHVEFRHKGSDTKVIFNTLFHEQDPTRLRSLIKNIKEQQNLSSFVLDLSPIPNHFINPESANQPENADEVSKKLTSNDFSFKLKDDSLRQYYKAMFHSTEENHSSDGLIYQNYHGKKVEIDYDLTLLAHFYALKHPNMNLYLSDLFFEETLKNMVANLSVDQMRDAYEFYRLFFLLDSFRLSSSSSENGCFKCANRQIKPADFYYVLSTAFLAPRELNGEIAGALTAEAFFKNKGSTIMTLNDPLYVESVFKSFLSNIQQIKITGQKTFNFDRFGFVNRQIELKFESIDETSSEREVAEKSVLAECMFGISADIQDANVKQEFAALKNDYKEYRENTGLGSWFPSPSDSNYFQEVKESTDCDIIRLLHQNLEDNEEMDEEKTEKSKTRFFESEKKPVLKIEKPEKQVEVSQKTVQEIQRKMNSGIGKTQIDIKKEIMKGSKQKLELKHDSPLKNKNRK